MIFPSSHRQAGWSKIPVMPLTFRTDLLGTITRYIRYQAPVRLSPGWCVRHQKHKAEASLWVYAVFCFLPWCNYVRCFALYKTPQNWGLPLLPNLSECRTTRSDRVYSELLSSVMFGVSCVRGTPHRELVSPFKLYMTNSVELSVGASFTPSCRFYYPRSRFIQSGRTWVITQSKRWHSLKCR